MEALTITHLSFAYPEQTQRALCDIDLTVEKGAFLVLCGYSGSGKSTLLRHLKPSLTPHGERSGEVCFNGSPLKPPETEATAAKIGFVMQSPEHQLVTDTVWHELAFGLENLGLDTPAIRRRTAEMASFFGIEDLYHRKAAELSGGQKQLVNLAAVMVMQPELLILDEPTAQLDPIAASTFLSALGKLNRELGTTVVLSEHRPEEALPLATKVAVMDTGRLLCTGTADEVGRRLKAEGSAMFAAMPAAMRVWSTVETPLPCPITVNDGRAFLHNYTQAHPVLPLPAREPSAVCGEVRVCAEEVWFRYERELPDTVKGLSLSVHAGELFCLLGGNGSGKTTALKLLAGLKAPYRGDIRLSGKVGLLPQDPQTAFVKKTVYEDLFDLLRQEKMPTAERENAITRVAKLCRITALLQRHPYDLSGGEQQRAALAKTLLLSPDILLLDEPTKGLDAPFKETLADILQTLKNRGAAILLVSHDTEFCARYADRCGLFFDGQLAAVAPATDFFAGNRFYTTAANRMAREIAPRAVTVEEVTRVIGGTLPPRATLPQDAPPAEMTAACEPPKAEKKLPLWRRLGAAVSALAALAVLLYAAKADAFRTLTDTAGITGAGRQQLVLYGVWIALLVLLAFFLGRRSRPPVSPSTPGKRPLPLRTRVAVVLILLLIPLTLWIGAVYVEQRHYYLTAVLVLLECMLPFFLIFEGRKPKARELVVVASLCAIAIAGRAAFFMLPQCKPVLALTVIAGVALGGETGFLVGAVTMLVSNLLFSQGPWTPWQMFAMGIIGFLAGLLYQKGRLRRSRGSLCVFGALCAIVIYGGIMNPVSALIWGGETLNFSILLSYYVTGFPMDAVHAAATALFLWFGAEPMLEKLDRIKTKYGLMN